MASRLTLCCVLLAAACARTTLQSSVADKYGGTKPTEEMDFWDGLAVQPAVSNRDAIHALCLSFGGAAGAYADELKVAKERGWIADDADLKADETARVGVVARAVCLQADIKGAQQVGMYAVWNDHAGTGLRPGSRVQPDRIIRRLGDLLEECA